MKKKYRLHYQVVDGYEPTDGKRNYLCFTIITPNSDKLKTLAIDEDIYRKILRKCESVNAREQTEKFIINTLKQRINDGKYQGSIELAV